MDKLKISAGNFTAKLKKSLEKTREKFAANVNRLFYFWKKLDGEFWEELEDLMLSSDVGVATTGKIIDELKDIAHKERITEPMPLMERMKDYIADILSSRSKSLIKPASGPAVILVVGVNGVGKTTSIAKLAHWLKSNDSKVMLAAADTFRAAAIDQLQIWANSLGVDIIKTKEGGDPSAVCFDAVAAAKARKADYLIIDTAGRLHSKSNLMEELKKIRRVIAREIPDAPHETLIVLDAATGKNALAQAKTFSEAAPLTGIILAKLDGTAKGGIILTISDELSVPVKFIGFGEKPEDFAAFNAAEFLDALFAHE